MSILKSISNSTLLAFVLTCSFGILGTANAQSWMTTQEGCTVWNQFPNDNEIASWSGACINGRTEGIGTLIWRWTEKGAAQSEQYLGVMVNGKMHGHGTLTMFNGQQYLGMFANGFYHGEGKFSYPEGDYYYGDFVNGLKHGVGTYNWRNGNTYFGDFRDDQMHGEGTCSINGRVFACKTRNNQFIK